MFIAFTFFGCRRQKRAAGREVECRERRVVRLYFEPHLHVLDVVDLQLAALVRSRKCQVGHQREAAQAAVVGRDVTYRVHQPHVANVVNVNTVSQAHDQAAAVQPNGENVAGIPVVADLGALLEMPDLE